MRALLLLGASVVAVSLVLGFTVFSGSPAKAARPSVHLVKAAPLKVRGEQFRPGENVRVTTGKRTVRTKTNGNGYFVITIPGSSRCESSRVLARGPPAAI
jgi:hypothetical protein